MKKPCEMAINGLFINGIGDYAPCCLFSNHLDYDREFNDISIVNSDTFKDLRKQHLTGNITSEMCRICMDRKSGTEYVPIENFDEFDYYDVESNTIDTDNYKVKELIFAMSNRCNLACRMCSSYNSNTWSRKINGISNVNEIFQEEKVKNHKELYNISERNFCSNKGIIDQILNTDIFSDVERVKIHGGEPFMESDLTSILKTFNPNKIKNLDIHTNGTIKPSDEILKLLNGLNANILFSIDSVSNVNDYIRIGCNTDKIKENIKYIKSKCPDCTLKLMSVITSESWIYLGDFVKEIITEYRDLGIHQWDTCKIYTYDFYSPGQALNDDDWLLGRKNLLESLVLLRQHSDTAFANRLSDTIKSILFSEKRQFNQKLHDLRYKINNRIDNRLDVKLL